MITFDIKDIHLQRYPFARISNKEMDSSEAINNRDDYSNSS